ncbi:MAG: helix-turn-helix transcriptional regulator [Isosphaeraceae bacterium]|nr:helix-turn-helix transcriptional regulator [Isosphaeraceae bacterium]
MKRLSGEIIREARIAKGYSLRQFARMAGISPTYLSFVERGSSHASPARFHKIATLLEIPMLKYTVEPWQAYDDEYAPLEIIGNVDTMADAEHQYERICTIDDGPNACGNAKLVIAAPALLAACQEAIIAINRWTTEPMPVGVYNRVARVLGDAISKATSLT